MPYTVVLHCVQDAAAVVFLRVVCEVLGWFSSIVMFYASYRVEVVLAVLSNFTSVWRAVLDDNTVSIELSFFSAWNKSRLSTQKHPHKVEGGI